MSDGHAWLTGWRVYTQLADRLRDRIVAGEYAAGSVLPSEAKLCQEFGIARNTARRGLAILEDEGLIVTIPSKGRVITAAAATPHAVYRYQLIAGDLREQIRHGELAAGAALPSELSLRRRYGASRNTVRQALGLLEREGLVVAEHGRGRFVRS
ncbi:Transcriptional regulator of succinyl CoA synthetase operon [[Actinomadura] parvosata subsp. kistnae]|uniref:GntR family transcriptional regulator n=1 Tax=[Actinomadura] parvosata subsp. kistnae TaxID=1909395 RepID=A0A1V0AC75_9ACTN|nr:GntR family transcriptional regulator [Nonomuraea sp. ATCC 55076]AQZ67769.1 GntR family transcriptional regulator [Nonomuraea sp. ATCC 55076]SPL93926.1 Transcriptional regulator of succinyl CoA synthetase operon [Actinomadura parvosata subsp. kistnae]